MCHLYSVKKSSKEPPIVVPASEPRDGAAFIQHVGREFQDLDVTSAMADVEPARPWERQPTDTETSWNAFRAYRDNKRTGRRSIRDTARILGVTSNALFELSTKYDFVDRCVALDRHMDGQKVQAVADVAAEASREAFRISSELIEQGRIQLEQLANLEGPEAVAMRRQITSGLAEAYKIQRQALGLPEHTSASLHVHRHEGAHGVDVNAMGEDQQLALRFALHAIGVHDAMPESIRGACQAAHFKLASAAFKSV